MSKLRSNATSGLSESDSFKKVRRLTEQRNEAFQRLKSARRALRGLPEDLKLFTRDGEEREARAREAQREAAYEALLSMKAGQRVGINTADEVQAAEARHKELTTPLPSVRARIVEERDIRERELSLVNERLSEARAELEAEAADEMRPTVTRWLAALSAFLEANEALHADELRLSDQGITPPVTAARDLALVTGEGSNSRLAWLLANERWTRHYTTELSEHKNTTLSPCLSRDRAEHQEAVRRFEERQVAVRKQADKAQKGRGSANRRGRTPFPFIGKLVRT